MTELSIPVELLNTPLLSKTEKSHIKHEPLVSQTRLKSSPRLKCKSELFQLKETCTE